MQKLLILFFSGLLSFSFSSTAQKQKLTDDQLLDLVQKQTFRYFWDFAHPVSGLARERSNVPGNMGNNNNRRNRLWHHGNDRCDRTEMDHPRHRRWSRLLKNTEIPFEGRPVTTAYIRTG